MSTGLACTPRFVSLRSVQNELAIASRRMDADQTTLTERNGTLNERQMQLGHRLVSQPATCWFFSTVSFDLLDLYAGRSRKRAMGAGKRGMGSESDGG